MAEKITVEAECIITSPAGQQRVRSFSKAWAVANELERPVRIALNGFVRKDA